MKKAKQTTAYNDRDAKFWKISTKSWMIINGREPEWRLKKEHVATFPKQVAAHWIEIFTRPGDVVLDPTMGSGSTLIAAALLKRLSIGIELYPDNIDLFRKIMNDYYLHEDQRTLDSHIGSEDYKRYWEPTILGGEATAEVRNIPDDSVDYIIFSPPYADTLHKSGGGVDTRSKQRKEKGMKYTYGTDKRDAGNMEYSDWLNWLADLADRLFPKAKAGTYMTIVVQNEVRQPFTPMAWEAGLEIRNRTDWELKPEKIWCQDNKPLTLAGWPSNWLTSNHHHYCLNFRKPGRRERP